MVTHDGYEDYVMVIIAWLFKCLLRHFQEALQWQFWGFLDDDRIWVFCFEDRTANVTHYKH